jgi:hypothetical protein
MASFSPCAGPLDRRTWLKVGGLSLGALATGIEPNLASLFAAERAEPSAAGRRPDKEFSVILFWANGGPSHLETFDLKPDAPLEIRGEFRPIPTNVPGIEITELLPKLAAMADKFTLLRNLRHNRAEHSGGTHRFLSGYSSRAANLPDAEYPELGSVVARQLDQGAHDVPRFVANTKLYGGGPAYLGPAYAPYMPNPNPVSSSGNNIYDPIPIYGSNRNSDILSIDDDGVVTLRRRQNLLASLDALSRELDASGMMAAMDTFHRRAIELLASQRTRAAFDLSQETARTRERYGDTHWGKSLLTCRRLVEAGVRFVQCQAEFRLKPETGRTSNWDDHSVNSHIFEAYKEKMPYFDHAVSGLIEDLYARGLNEHVLFIFCGEFGRTPRIANQDPSRRPGRDHWPRAMSIFLSGGGLKMGQVVGATNRRGEEPTKRIMDSNCLLATIYHRFGIDTRQHFLDLTGRPIPILTDGEPIEELL